MKKEIFVILLFIILLYASFFTLNAQSNKDTITGETVTGEVTNANLAVSISLTVGLPSITIISPENKTYLTNTSLLLNYSASDTSVIWYNIDNTVNTTINSPIYFNTSQGSHTLYLYANNTGGNETSKNVSFTANSTKFIILYSEYNSSTKGNSTDFILYSYEDVQNLSNIILENTNYGKILFNQAINLTADENQSDNLLDLNNNTNISNNRIELDSTVLPNFNKPATLWLYNLNFSTPRILKDGVVCSAPACVQERYSGGILKFNVTGFTVYEAEETPSGIIPSGGGKWITKKDFSIDKENIKISLKQGETKEETITIKNEGNTPIKINLENLKLKDFIKISETEFYLNVDESKTIILDFIARENTLPDLYIGKLIVKADGIEKEILIAIEIETKKALFDVKVDIPKKFLRVLPGEELFAEIELYNLGEIKRVDVNLEYIIKDSEGNIIVSEQETLAVETRTNFIKKFNIPKDIKSGKYIFYVRVIYEEEVASASAWFSIGIPFILRYINLIIISIITLLVIIVIVIYKARKKKQKYGKTRRKPIHIKIKQRLSKLMKPSKKKEEGFRDYKKRMREQIEKNKN